MKLVKKNKQKRHILINPEDGDPKDAKQNLKDSILYAVRNDSSKFSKLVLKIL